MAAGPIAERNQGNVECFDPFQILYLKCVVYATRKRNFCVIFFVFHKSSRFFAILSQSRGENFINVVLSFIHNSVTTIKAYESSSSNSLRLTFSRSTK